VRPDLAYKITSRKIISVSSQGAAVAEMKNDEKINKKPKNPDDLENGVSSYIYL
jgi:hypothetical protein